VHHGDEPGLVADAGAHGVRVYLPIAVNGYQLDRIAERNKPLRRVQHAVVFYRRDENMPAVGWGFERATDDGKVARLCARRDEANLGGVGVYG
jgi:hypothetical protein